LIKYKFRKDRKFNNKDTNFDDLWKVVPLFFLISFIEFKKIYCYKATNKELDRVRNLIEEEIKNLEFRYKGLLKREPIKYSMKIFFYFPFKNKHVLPILYNIAFKLNYTHFILFNKFFKLAMEFGVIVFL